jgi:type IV secretion system protein VirB1
VITGMEIAACQHMAVPAEVMQHVVNVESAYNPFAIGVVGGHLVRQPKNLGEAEATVRMLESKGYNFSVGLAQVNRANLSKYGITSYDQAFDICPNLTAGARILSECYASSGDDWGKSFSCYYSGNFITGYRDGYVQKIIDSINTTAGIAAGDGVVTAVPIQMINGPSPSSLHRSTAGSEAALMAPDSASHRLAIRSTALDSAAVLATKSVDAALAPASANPAHATAQAVPADASDTSAGVFKPQVRSLSDPPLATEPAANGDQPKQVAAAVSMPAADSADLRQTNRDDALVF